MCKNTTKSKLIDILPHVVNILTQTYSINII